MSNPLDMNYITDMNEVEIRELVKALDTSKTRQEEETWSQLKPLGQAVIPYLAEFYPLAKKWQCRVALIFHSIHYAKTSDIAFQLGITALNDRATVVRYRACGLLAYSLRKEAIPYLKQEKFSGRSIRKINRDDPSRFLSLWMIGFGWKLESHSRRKCGKFKQAGKSIILSSGSRRQTNDKVQSNDLEPGEFISTWFGSWPRAYSGIYRKGQ